MADKAYIVANEKQEREVLEKLQREGLVWIMGREKPTEWVPSRDAPSFTDFPIVLTDEGEVSWWFTIALEDEEIIYDGRG